MPIDPGIIGQLQPPPPPPSVEQQARTQLLVEEAKQRRQAVIEEAQDSAAIQTAFRAHQSETGTDYQGVLRDLGTASPRAAMKFQVFLTKQQDDAAKQQQEEWKAQSAQAEGLTRLFQGIDKTPDPAASYAAAKQLLPPNIAKTLPETYDPTVTERIVAHGTNVKEFNDKENQAFERVMGKGTAEQGIGETLALTTSPEDFKQRIARLSLYVPKDMLQPYLTLGPTPEMVQHAQQAALGTKEVATLAGQAEGRQITREDAAARLAQTVSNDAALRNEAAQRIALEKQSIGIAGAHLGIAQDELKLKQQAATGADAQVLKPGTPNYRQAQDLADGTLTFQDFQRLHSRAQADAPLRAAIYDTARQLNPNFNPSAFEIGYKFASNPKVRQQISSLKNVEMGVDDLLKFSDKASRSGIPVLNKALQLGGVNLGGKSYSNFQTAVTAFADELSGALGYGSATDMSREMGFKMTDLSQSPETFRSNIETVVLPFVARKKASIVGEMGPYAGGANPTSGAGSTKPTAADLIKKYGG